jgi:protein involved in polysaccharide export with SLBB domain
MSMRWLLASFLVLVTAACSSAPPFDAKAVATEWAAFMQRDYVLRAGDRLSILVDTGGATRPTAGATEAPDNVQEVVVSPTGTIDLRRLPAPLSVAGRSVGAVRTMVLDAYKTEFRVEPTISVTLTEASAQSVYVCGEVNRPGPVPYVPGLTMTQSIAAAGSFQITVKHSDVRILRINADGTQRTFRVNMNAVLLDEWPDFLLLPGDVVYAQTSTVADIGNLVELYIRRMLPFQLGGPALGTVN